MKICYEPKRFQQKTLDLIDKANEIIESYSQQGYDLTLRQLYYQLVTKNILKNCQKEYKRLGTIISDARRAGLIDWNAIVDRTRSLRGFSNWESPQSIIRSAAYGYREDLWKNQQSYIEIWFEKDALLGVFERAAEDYRIPYFSCRGYVSDSEIWSAAQRLKEIYKTGKDIILLHFGDHDPSGLDMSRDIEVRLTLFGLYGFEVKRLALNYDQIQQYGPPPNPAKDTDARFEKYEAEFGDESWELDALDPATLNELVKEEVEDLIDLEQWEKDKEIEEEKREELMKIFQNYNKVVEWLKDIKKYA